MHPPFYVVDHKIDDRSTALRADPLKERQFIRRHQPTRLRLTGDTYSPGCDIPDLRPKPGPSLGRMWAMVHRLQLWLAHHGPGPMGGRISGQKSGGPTDQLP